MTNRITISAKELANKVDDYAVKIHLYMLHKYHETTIRKDLQKKLWDKITRDYSMVPVFGGNIYLHEGVEYTKLYY